MRHEFLKVCGDNQLIDFHKIPCLIDKTKFWKLDKLSPDKDIKHYSKIINAIYLI